MSHKILVPTDFSANSKAGVRFAVQLASQNNSTLVMYHCMELLKPMRWTDAQHANYVKKHLEQTSAHLEKFLHQVCDQMGLSVPRFECVSQEGSDPKQAIIKYAGKISATAICMGTRGAGKIKKMIGTNSSGILAKSPVPVFVIPGTYRKTPITNILYASDMDHVQSELKRVTEFAKPLKAGVFVYHYNEKVEAPETRKKLTAIADKNEKPGITFTFQKFHAGHPFAEHLEADIKKSKASVAVLFTNQKRGWYDKLFQSSRSAEVSFNSRIPLLVFAKD